VKHIITYVGQVGVSLGLMQEAYMTIFLPWANRRVGIEGTLLRAPYSPESGNEWIRGLDKSKGTDEVFAVLLHIKGKEKYRYVGHMGIHKIIWPHGFALTGSILNPDFQGKSYGTEAKLLVLYHAFCIRGLRKIVSTVKVWNGRSLGHLLKCGYKVCGKYKAHHFHEGAYIDEFILEIFREDWEPIWEKYQKTKTLPSLTPKQRAFIKKETGK
jgi:RimJ/RimL family protein N-acetyltransferase